MNEGNEEQGEAQSENSERRPGQVCALESADLPSNLESVRMLGQGSMARVFLARNTSLKRLVAIKVLREELVADPISRKRFVREAQAAAQISHPSVTSVYSVGNLGNDFPYIEMEYIEGKNLAEILRSHGRLGISAARNLLAQLASALAAAHDNRVIHRDVKPANVLVAHDSDSVFLTDFGVAGILESGSAAVTRLTREGDRIGDPTYMSPEQLRGEVVTEQTDIYSLGILGYEVLTLHGPFDNLEVTDISAAHFRRTPLDLHVARTDIPIDLSDLLKQCLAKKPQHRPRAKDLVNLFGGANSVGTNGEMPTVADATSPNLLVSFLRELQKRNVYRVAVAYAAITFVALQAADLVLPPFGAPPWAFKLLVVASLSGFPIAVALAWLFDLRQGRLLRTDGTSGSFSRTTSWVQRLLLQALGLSLSIVIAVAMAWWLLAPDS